MALPGGYCGICPHFFDIVNGFLIDAVAHRVWFKDHVRLRHYRCNNLAEIIVHA